MCNEKWETFRATFQCHHVILNPPTSVIFCTEHFNLKNEMKKGISGARQDLNSHSGQKKLMQFRGTCIPIGHASIFQLRLNMPTFNFIQIRLIINNAGMHVSLNCISFF